MSKRFIDTGLFDDPWFMDLSKDAKLLWIYMITRCDHAGIIELNKRLVIFQTDIKDLDTLIKELGNRLITLNEQLTVFFIPKFIEFQYPNFPQSNVKQQQGAIKQLEKYGLFLNGKVTVNKELVNSYGNDNGNESVNGNESDSEKLRSGICIYDAKELCDELFNSQQWIDYILTSQIAKEKRIEWKQLEKYITAWIEEQRINETLNRSIGEYKRHFFNWFKKKMETYTPPKKLNFVS